MADVKLALEELKEESESGISARPVAGAAVKRRWLIPAMAGVVLLAAAGLFWKMRDRSERV